MGHRPAGAVVAAMLALSAIVVGCGSDGDDADDSDGTPTRVVGTTTAAAGGSPAGGGQSTATREAGESATPAPSATPEVSATAEASATPEFTQLIFDTADSGNGANTATSTGPLGVVYAASSFRLDLPQDRVETSAYVNVGINERPSASAWLSNQFRAPGEGTKPVTAQIATGVRWQGVLAGNGAAGTRATITITVSVLENGSVIATEQVHMLEQREALLTVGGFDDSARADVAFDAQLVPGTLYELRMTVTCEAASGLIGVATHCVYGPSDIYDDGYVEWEQRRIDFGP